MLTLFELSCSLYFSILTRMYRFTGNETHFDYAMNTLNWWLEWAFDVDNGRVWDTITADYSGQSMRECTRSSEQTWTYNSGAFLFGLADLYYATGDDRVLDLGRSIAYAAIRDFSDEETGILVEHCENDPPPEPGKPPGCQQDETIVRYRPGRDSSGGELIALTGFVARSSRASSCSACRSCMSLDPTRTSTTSSTRSC